MVDTFYGRVLSNPDLKPFFKDVPIDRLQRMQREFFSAATGGPVVYSGKPLSHVHQNLGITRRHFQQYTEHLIETLEEKGINEKEILNLISRVNVYADEIIGETGVDG
ncbi:UNVERIFIED_CONTAM: hypothetical protein GTU68_001184 [Idotea baltica]|nr:hypothetical protein [Idotea baltica]